ncbi:hypothetical protein HY478_00130 [Candidatus Uhrbacteria bacterium]|nr:hypothetical protein [Candidatus Uhrbacteria bacterium]
MSNLLPKDALRTLSGWERSRLLLVGSLSAIALGFIVLLSLAPLYLMHAEFGQEIPEVKLPASQQTERESIARAAILVRELKGVASSTSAVDILQAVINARPPKVTISSIGYVRGNPSVITIGGIAPSRDEISAYRTVLSKDPRFTSVSVPLGTLTGADGGRFSITLSGTF